MDEMVEGSHEGADYANGFINRFACFANHENLFQSSHVVVSSIISPTSIVAVSIRRDGK